MLEVIRRVDSNWYEGRRSGGSSDDRAQGIFPISYVDTLVEPQSAMSTPMSSLAASPLPGQTLILASSSPSQKSWRKSEKCSLAVSAMTVTISLPPSLSLAAWAHCPLVSTTHFTKLVYFILSKVAIVVRLSVFVLLQ